MLAPTPPAPPAVPPAPRARRLRRALLWGMLVALLGVAQTLLVALTINYESGRAQDETDATAAEAAAEVRHELLALMQQLQALAGNDPTQPATRAAAQRAAQALLQNRPELRRLEWRALDMQLLEAADTPYPPPLFLQMPRSSLAVEAELACAAAQRSAAPAFSRSYFVPLPAGQGVEVVDLCLPVLREGRQAGFVVGSLALVQVLQTSVAVRGTRQHEFSFVEADGTRLARAGAPRGAGVYVGERVVDLPGNGLRLRAVAAAGRPSLIPNLATALVLGLSIALFGVVLALARDVRRRAQAEAALAESLAFRKAMEDSLSTGLRARDLQGRITYVNPAFCAMVGFSADELLASGPQPGATPPYWPPEFVAEYQRRQAQRLGAAGGEPEDGAPRAGMSREGYETVFMRRNGERFPVMIYEAPLVNGQGQHTGWMSAVLDVSVRRRMEEVSRQQQERLQASARLATVGEMASLMSHELNQPLAAIASYATGSLNLLAEADARADPQTPGLLQQALARIAEQAERAGRVIKSVHGFVRRREALHEALGAEALFDEVMPLARMQARKSGTRIEVDLPPPPERAPRVRCDRTMVEQVLLNLARNGLQAMEGSTPAADRVLTLRARQTHPNWVTFSVCDSGPGIPPEVGARLFTPFFTTKPEGMGLGLSLCRTVIEQHGGALDFGPGPGGKGTEFRFTLPAARGAERGEAAARTEPAAG